MSEKTPNLEPTNINPDELLAMSQKGQAESANMERPNLTRVEKDLENANQVLEGLFRINEILTDDQRVSVRTDLKKLFSAAQERIEYARSQALASGALYDPVEVSFEEVAEKEAAVRQTISSRIAEALE